MLHVDINKWLFNIIMFIMKKNFEYREQNYAAIHVYMTYQMQHCIRIVKHLIAITACIVLIVNNVFIFTCLYKRFFPVLRIIYIYSIGMMKFTIFFMWQDICSSFRAHVCTRYNIATFNMPYSILHDANCPFISHLDNPNHSHFNNFLSDKTH